MKMKKSFVISLAIAYMMILLVNAMSISNCYDTSFSPILTKAVTSENYIYFCTNDGYLYQLSKTDFSLINYNHLNMGNSCGDSDLIYYNNTVYVSEQYGITGFDSNDVTNVNYDFNTLYANENNSFYLNYNTLFSNSFNITKTGLMVSIGKPYFINGVGISKFINVGVVNYSRPNDIIADNNRVYSVYSNKTNGCMVSVLNYHDYNNGSYDLSLAGNLNLGVGYCSKISLSSKGLYVTVYNINSTYDFYNSTLYKINDTAMVSLNNIEGEANYLFNRKNLNPVYYNGYVYVNLNNSLYALDSSTLNTVFYNDKLFFSSPYGYNNEIYSNGNVDSSNGVNRLSYDLKERDSTYLIGLEGGSSPFIDNDILYIGTNKAGDNAFCRIDLNSGYCPTGTCLNMTDFTFVDVNDKNKGFLPELYDGITAFISYSFIPLFIFIILIIIVLLFISLIGIVIKIAKGLL